MVISSLSVYHIFQILCAIDIYIKREVFLKQKTKEFE